MISSAVKGWIPKVLEMTFISASVGDKISNHHVGRSPYLFGFSAAGFGDFCGGGDLIPLLGLASPDVSFEGIFLSDPATEVARLEPGCPGFINEP
jgi:hypothetical protein